MNKKIKTLISGLLCAVMIVALFQGAVPMNAYAVSQAEIDALKAQRNAISSQRQEKQAIVEDLEVQ